MNAKRCCQFISLFAGAWNAKAQCVMCNRTAAAQSVAMAAVFNHGIVILLIPPFVILAGFAWFALRKNLR
jgi:hypothetical protein